nr:MAG TPA: hypothetical protein [Caudoviricetes sp.]
MAQTSSCLITNSINAQTYMRINAIGVLFLPIIKAVHYI